MIVEYSVRDATLSKSRPIRTLNITEAIVMVSKNGGGDTPSDFIVECKSVDGCHVEWTLRGDHFLQMCNDQLMLVMKSNHQTSTAEDGR